MKKFGYRVTDIISSGEEVMSRAIELKPDLVLMDIRLSGNMSGIEVAGEIKRIMDIPIIYLTAYADRETIQKAKLTEPFAYIEKPFEEKSLRTSIEIAVHKHQISKKLRERTIELEEEKKKSDLLIHNILPKQIVKELRETGQIKPREYKMVTLLFTDFQDFSTLASQMKPHELVSELNEIFMHFDKIIDESYLEKLKTIGDSYMAGCGFPDECSDHAVKVVKAAMKMQSFIAERNDRSRFKWPMRAGIHSGNVVAGVIGKNKMTYDVWGNTVNIANRMERNGKPGKVNISYTTYNLIKDYFNCEFYDSLKINDKKKIEMYFVHSEKI
jgi:class 3 adenylate cyclase/CheY-like chemotaxis protein